ncbi:nucleotide exchange factor GrpE [Zobellia galactanivorans]|uniref:Protein GrpE n=1 Tax=Zobellia galactanivorans (strain DSM 12802 / CCUG 47099 / CIP 106680 / NCIMB 13871 / Dsij) TaxID=63186 RepID=G0L6I3_ZOBGA|nr:MULTISPECIES: nucleotide exchange factor GrpE [Zobellia]MBU3025430.1 nucleotide exchange factor GrpE [Zobellia galactanivorans]MDO6810353.1 nucleotide exchange factor GrpE [Zobellia galactanivorans]OWW25168.1 nucleotide exchange factor GrpE [Zobellia sp. OII3]CAZ96970.1 Co-chaperone HSP-70 protein [Zobellia galactanivorans]
MSDKEKAEDFEEVVDQEEQTEVESANDIEQEEDMQEELSVEEQLREDLAKEKDKFLRLFAEFENFKRRTSKERMDLFKTAGQEIIISLLPVLDDFERALKEMAKSEDKEMFKGVELIRVKFRETLKSKGLEEVHAEVGDAFDAEIHEAITQIPAPNKKLKGKIVDVVEKGFKLGDRIIRHPKVVVGN